jgi:hypothetical protein
MRPTYLLTWTASSALPPIPPWSCSAVTTIIASAFSNGLEKEQPVPSASQPKSMKLRSSARGAFPNSALVTCNSPDPSPRIPNFAKSASIDSLCQIFYIYAPNDYFPAPIHHNSF